MPTKTANWRYPRAERISGTQLDIVALVAAANVTRGQAAAAVRGEISGKQTEAAYHAAIKTSNDLWEWYAAMRTELDYCVGKLRDLTIAQAEEGL